LFLLHPLLDVLLETGDLSGFYPLHQIYLNASTAQWAANLALLAVTLWIWRERAPTTQKTPIGSTDSD
jgi:hypothetical protein